MFVVIVEQRISAERKGVDAPSATDWYLLMATALPFVPYVGTEIEIKEDNLIMLRRVVYKPAAGTFWSRIDPILHPKPNAEQLAKKMLDEGIWDEMVKEEDLKEARKQLAIRAYAKLKSAIIQVGTSMVGMRRAIGGLAH